MSNRACGVLFSNRVRPTLPRDQTARASEGRGLRRQPPTEVSRSLVLAIPCLRVPLTDTAVRAPRQDGYTQAEPLRR